MGPAWGDVTAPSSAVFIALAKALVSREMGAPKMTPRNTILASNTGAKLGSNVQTGGGDDDTKFLQAALDSATESGGVHLVMDGAALVTGLRVHSNTTIECRDKTCGFFLADRANGPVLANAHPSATARIDRNITLIGGTYNQNCRQQAHHLPEDVHYSQARELVVGLRLLGVENVLLRDVVIQDFRTFAVLLTNWAHVTMENIRLELPQFMAGANQDGIHVQGPGQFLVLRNISGKTSDDFIALNGDEESNGQTSWFHPAATVGPMSDIVVDTLLVEEAAQVVRILSRENSQDRITIRNVSGRYKSFGFYLSAWDYRARGLPGNFGSIFIENVDLRQTESIYNYTAPFLFRISGRHQSLQLKNIRYHHPRDDRHLIHLEGRTDVPEMGDTPADVQSLVIDGLHIQDDDCRQGKPYIGIEGRVRHFALRNSEVLLTNPREPVKLIETKGDLARVDALSIANLAASGLAVVVADDQHAVKNLSLSNVVVTNP
jgi:hypothetical protein